jgi:hypothetical protein
VVTDIDREHEYDQVDDGVTDFHDVLLVLLSGARR